MPVLIALVTLLFACSSPGADRASPSVPATSAYVRWPLVVDSHVHLAYYPVGERLLAHGVGTVVDLGSPEAALRTASPVTTIHAGPMITRPGGYPLNSWGANGYGIGCEDTACVTATIDRLADEGAAVIKLALDPGGLPRDFVDTAIEKAHARGLRVAVHALTEEAAARAAAAGADILAHTPAEPLSDATVAAWKKGAVISTLAAFGSADAVENLRKLRAAGATILYGTDLGNVRTDGVSADELALLRKAGMDDAAITDAMTTTPIAFWHLAAAADTYLELDGDPRKNADVFLHPHAVVVHGKQLR